MDATRDAALFLHSTPDADDRWFSRYVFFKEGLNAPSDAEERSPRFCDGRRTTMMTTGTSPSTDAGYQRSLEVHRQIEALYPHIEQATAYFRGVMPVDSALPRPPGTISGVTLDPLVCALAIKAATTKRALLAVCELGDGDNALALARVLLENACLLEWLIRGDGQRRLEAYAMFISVQAERVVQTVDRHHHRFIASGAESKPKSDPFHRSVWK